MKVGPTLRLLCRNLGNVHAALLELAKEGTDIRHLDGRQDQGNFLSCKLGKIRIGGGDEGAPVHLCKASAAEQCAAMVRVAGKKMSMKSIGAGPPAGSPDEGSSRFMPSPGRCRSPSGHGGRGLPPPC